MSDTLEAIKNLIAAGEVRISEHGYDELADDGIRVRDILAGVVEAAVVEDYPDFPKGLLSWCYNLTRKAVQFMSYGGFRKAAPVQLWS